MIRIQKKALRSAIVVEARRLKGAAYQDNAVLEDAPHRFNCSSFVRYIFNFFGIALPPGVVFQARCGREIKANEILKRGDLLFFKGRNPRPVEINCKNVLIGHVAIYIGNGKMIHCTRKRGVVVRYLDNLKKPIVLIKRIL